MKSADRLQQFRRQCERSAKQPASEIDLPLLHVLSDVCKALGLKARDRRKVLGRKGVQELGEYREWRIGLK